ncbi:MAG TPA: efflux RND transporter periplasmic adaptor subunit [Alkalispirochaeta sp.]|nr:efflux RND transporter periplasmic adaptor subunit [Alkalispirochaeta sp.]
MRRAIQVWSVVTAAVLLAACGGDSDGRSAATGNWAQEEAEAAPALAVEALEVTRGTLLQTVQASGTVRGAREVSVVAEVEGRIQESLIRLGEPVEAGDVLLRVDSTVAELNVAESRGSLESARLDLSATERRFENGSASQAEVTRARSAANGAEARYETALKALEDHTLRAPISGFVAERAQNLSAGNYLNRGTAVTRIVDLQRLEMEVAVGERELQYLQPGLAAEVEIPACDTGAAGAEIEAIAAGADPRTGSFAVVVGWNNSCSQVRSGMNATVRIRPSSDETQLVIPSAAIRSDGSEDYVYVAIDGVVERRVIESGNRLGDRVYVSSGLSQGEIIVISALSSLSDGMEVEPTVRATTGETL